MYHIILNALRNKLITRSTYFK